MSRRRTGLPKAMVALALAAAAACSAAAPLTPERVTFDSLDRDPMTGVPIRLTALRYTPDRDVATTGAVIALHGCSGIFSSVKGREALPTLHYQAVAEMLVAQGYVVVFPDSFNPRGRREVCTLPLEGRTITQVNRRLDALGALAWLQSQPGVAPDRVALVGWSHGGGTVLATDSARQPAVAAFHRDRALPFFATAIAFYPGCSGYTRPETYVPAAPLTILIGAADDWTPAAPCVALGAAAAVRGLPLVVNVYPDSYHGFDAPAGALRVRTDVAGGVHPGQGVTLAPNPVARADAHARVRDILRQSIGRPADAPVRRHGAGYFTP